MEPLRLYPPQKPKNIDVLILSLFVILITVQPFFLHGRINIFEVGLYLPGINAILNGLVPFRDVFHLRGGFELYMPASLMSIFGTHLGVLFSYFYIGNVLCLVIAVLIARELFQTRLFLYLMIPVFVARTFPRVVFSYWGGLRYAFGLLALYCVVRFFRSEKNSWIFLAGVASALGVWTSVEIGVCSIAGVLVAFLFARLCQLQTNNKLICGLGIYLAGFGLISLPYLVYLIGTHSLWPLLDSFWTVVTNKENILDTHLVSEFPRNPIELVQVLFNPMSKNFRHITPVYVYLAFLFYFIYRRRQARLSKVDLGVIAIGVYGVVMYNAAFRNIWAAQFEMALQIEKFVYFYLLEGVYLWLRDKRDALLTSVGAYFPLSKKRLKRQLKLYLIMILFAGLIGSSLGYAIQRLNHRFFAFQFIRNSIFGKDTTVLKPWAHETYRPLTIERARGIMVPAQQAEELEQIVAFVQKNTAAQEIILMYPELGAYSFFVDRPFVGRFPGVTFTWFKEQWHEQWLAVLKKVRPRYVIMPQRHPHNWEAVYLAPQRNRDKYNAVMDFVRTHYVLEQTTALSNIYKLSTQPYPPLAEPFIKPYEGR